MNILAINPWIYDFAAYDFWLKPYGFLVILEYLKNAGFEINYLDCLDKKETLADFGRGKYPAETIPKPKIFAKIPRYYKRYGITPEEFLGKLPITAPDYILITSSMTYWYEGIIEVVRLVKEKFPQTPVILGGTYATLCQDHAKANCGCEAVFSNTQLNDFFKLLNVDVDFKNLYSLLPRYENFYQKLDYVVLRTSWGCPFSCSYCAIKKLYPYTFRLGFEEITNYISHYASLGLKDFVLYDDAFLYDQEYVLKFLNELLKRNLSLRIHTPNALHLRYLNEDIAKLLKQSGFINPHFGLETLNPDLQKQWGDKVTRADLIQGIEMLKKGGFKNGEFSVYLLLGIPGQDLKALKEDVDLLHSLGAKVSFAEFSPVPGTVMFKDYQEHFSEPLMQNNSVFGNFQAGRLKEFYEIKNYLRELNRQW